MTEPAATRVPRPSSAGGHADPARPVPGWRIRGSYFESCNCDAICPCRRIDGKTGGRSTHGICTGVLTWLIEDGRVGDVDVTGLSVALAVRYDDDEPGSPWSWILYLDRRGSEAQQAALSDLFAGRLGGDALEHFPWAWKPSEQLAVRSVEIEVDHRRHRQRLRIRDLVDVTIRGAYEGEERVSCVIPGHDRGGRELVAARLVVEDEALAMDYSGTCGYCATFDYSG